MKRTIITTAGFVASVAAFVVTVPGAGAQKPAPGALSITAAPVALKFGGAVTLSGKLTGPNVDGRNVRVEEDPFPLDSFGNAGSATTNATGDWSLVVKPSATTRYRASVGKVDSPTVDVSVRPAITLRLSDRTPARGQRVRFSGRLCPEHDNVAIELQRRTSSGWKTVRNPVLKDIAGSTCSKYATRRRVRKSSTYRTHFAGDADHAAGNSRRKRARVH